MQHVLHGNIQHGYIKFFVSCQCTLKNVYEIKTKKDIHNISGDLVSSLKQQKLYRDAGDITDKICNMTDNSNNKLL